VLHPHSVGGAAQEEAPNLWAIAGAVALYQDKDAFGPIKGLAETWPNCAGYRVVLRGRLAENMITKCQMPTISENPALTITLSVSDGSSIYYTLDGSFPGPGNAGDSFGGPAVKYAAPFVVAANTTVRYASYQAGFIGSDTGASIVTS